MSTKTMEECQVEPTSSPVANREGGWPRDKRRRRIDSTRPGESWGARCGNTAASGECGTRTWDHERVLEEAKRYKGLVGLSPGSRIRTWSSKSRTQLPGRSIRRNENRKAQRSSAVAGSPQPDETSGRHSEPYRFRYGVPGHSDVPRCSGVR